MHRTNLRKLLHKLSHGTLSHEEKTELKEAVTHMTPEQLKMLYPDENTGFLEEVPASLQEKENSAKALTAVWQQLQQEANETQAPVIPIRRSWWQSAWAATAGAAVVMVIVLTQLFKQQQVAPDTSAALAWIETTTHKGAQRMVTLQDGTVIHVNGNTRLRYPAVVEDTVRRVELIAGEIFLDVEPVAGKPFRISTGGANVDVLGTAFSIRNKEQEKEVVVAVQSGKVALDGKRLGAAPDRLLLTAGFKGVFDKQQQRLHRANCDVNAIGGWRSGAFEFEDAPLRQILSALEDRYGFTYSIQQPAMADKRLRAVFKGQKPEDMVRVLSKMADFNYIIKDSIIVIQ